MFGDQQDFEEEDFVIPSLKQLEFVLQPSQKIVCNTLHVAFYGVSSLFVSTLVDTSKANAQINFQKAKQKSLASIYLNQTNQSSDAYIIFNEEFEKMREIHFADFVSANFQFRNLYIFTSIARGILEKDDGSTLKLIQNSWGLDLHGPLYNQGLSGPEADLLVWSQLNGINAVCFIGIYGDYEVNKQVIVNIFGSLTKILPFQSNYEITKQIKAYNMKKYSNKLYL